jgi:hypothetical protein
MGASQDLNSGLSFSSLIIEPRCTLLFHAAPYFGIRSPNTARPQSYKQHRKPSKNYLQVAAAFYYSVAPITLSPGICIYTATKIPFMCSFSGNCAASVPISTFCGGLYIPRIDPHIFLQQNRHIDGGII